MKTTFYQAVFNGYDRPEPPKDRPAGINYVCTAGAVDGGVAAVFNRQHKILQAPRIGDFSVYMDGNIGFAKPIRAIAEWANITLADGDIAICRHAARKCAFVEIEACVGRKKITHEEADRAHRVLIDEKLPKNFGLWECGIILRRVNTTWLDLLHREWFNLMVEHNVWRDQIWLPLALQRLGSKVPAGKLKTIEMDVRSNHWFTFKPHA